MSDARSCIAKYAEILRYVIIGIVTFSIFISISSVPIEFPFISHGVAAGISIVVSSIFNFLAHYFFTFESKKPILAASFRYIILVLFNSFVGGIFVQGLTHFLNIHLILANLLCASLLTVMSYFSVRGFVM